MSRTLIFSIVGVAVVAVLAVATLFAVRSLGSPDLDLPDELAGLTALDSDAATGNGDDEQRAAILERATDSRDYNEEKFSEALDGAEVATRAYIDLGDADSGLEQLSVVATDTDLGPLLPEGFPDPDVLQVAEPTVEWSEDGDVQCLVRRAPVPAGDDGDAELQSVVCQRTSGSLSVRVSTGGGDVDAVVDAVEQVYDDIS